MKRWWLVIVLLLSLGVNLGLLAAVAAQRRQPQAPASPPAEPRERPRPAERPAPRPSPTPGEPVRVVEEPPKPPAPVPERPVPREERPPGPPPPPAGSDEGFEPRDPEGPPLGEPGPGGEGAPPRIPPLPRLADHLGLEGEARRRFLEIQLQFFQRSSRLRLQQSEVQRELRRALTRGEPDKQAIDRLLQESARIHLGLERGLVENVLASREVLTDQQARQFMQLLGRMRREAGRPPGAPPAGGRRPLRRWQEGRGAPLDGPPLPEERGGPPSREDAPLPEGPPER